MDLEKWTSFFNGTLYDNLNEVYNLGPNLSTQLSFPRIKPMSNAIDKQKKNLMMLLKILTCLIGELNH